MGGHSDGGWFLNPCGRDVGKNGVSGAATFN